MTARERHDEVETQMSNQARGQTTSLSPEALDDYMSAGVVSLIPHGQAGDHLLQIDPERKEITLWSPADGTYEDPGEMENIAVDLDETEEPAKYILTVSTEDVPDAAYALSYAIVRQTDAGIPYGQALRTAVDQFRNLLRSRRRLSPAQETGLIGELTVLLHLIRAIGADAAVEAWLGPDAEEHDFGLEGYDLEVKTTLGEDRRHVIHGVDQLAPTPGRNLWLLSLQFTAAGRGEGSSLTALALEAINAVGAHGVALERVLDSAGWRHQDADLYRKRYTLRTAPRTFEIDLTFPAITRERIASAVPNSGLIGNDVTYRVDVGALPYGVPGPEFDDFLEEPHHA